MNRKACDDFRKLHERQEEGPLRRRDQQRYDEHLNDCGECAEWLESRHNSLFCLRLVKSEVEPSEGFSERLQTKMQGLGKQRLAYWSPAIVGAAVTALFLLMLLQVATGTAANAVKNQGYGEARRLRVMPSPLFETPTPTPTDPMP
jgi:predicted anti-sigma-YlaC factor YlaD